MFIIQSPYDSWCIPMILGISCANDGTLSKCTAEELEAIGRQREETLLLIYQTLSKRKDWGAWMPACINHVYNTWQAYNSVNYEIPM